MPCKSCGRGRNSAVRSARRAAEAKLRAEKIARAQARQAQLKKNAVSKPEVEAPVQPEVAAPAAPAQPEPSPSSELDVNELLEAETQAEGQKEGE